MDWIIPVAGLCALLSFLWLSAQERKAHVVMSSARQQIELQKLIMQAKIFFVALHEHEEDEMEQRSIAKTIRAMDAALGTNYSTMTFSYVEELIESYQGMVDTITEAMEKANASTPETE